MALNIPPPTRDEYADFHAGYISHMANEPDAVAVLERQRQRIAALGTLTADQAGYRYAAGKWSVREIIGHLADSERVFSYRLLCIARGESGVLPGFDEQAYGAQSNADRRPLADLVAELLAVREATLALVRSLDESALSHRGQVNAWTLSVRALAHITAGHCAHHFVVLSDRYGV